MLGRREEESTKVTSESEMMNDEGMMKPLGCLSGQRLNSYAVLAAETVKRVFKMPKWRLKSSDSGCVN